MLYLNIALLFESIHPGALSGFPNGLLDLYSSAGVSLSYNSNEYAWFLLYISNQGDESQSESETNDDSDLIDGIADGIAQLVDAHPPVEVGEPISESDINFDRSLPGRHTVSWEHFGNS